MRRWLPFAWVVLACAVVTLQQITLPGVYMDAVNPDYMVVGVLNHSARDIGAMVLPGNHIHGRYPILASFYHGTQQLWLGLPFFWLFGTTVAGLRLTHAMFALFVLAALYAFLGRSGPKPWQAALACSALAIDPSFSYAFRTQSYITLAPVAWLFLSLYALARSAGERRAQWLFASGLFYGFAVLGYFVYAFFLPALVLALRWYGATPRSVREWGALIIGGFLGALFYMIGYALVMKQLGPAATWDYFQQTQRAINAFSEQPGLVTRLAHAAEMIDSVFRNWFHHELIFGEQEPLPGGSFKMGILIGATLLLWARAEWKRVSAVPLRVMIALAVSFVAVALVFGTRLSGHHFMVLLPISYGALALAAVAASQAPPAWRSANTIVTLPLVMLIALNVGGQVKEGMRLHELRGVGLYSDAINQLAQDLDKAPRKPFVYFPDWGLAMPVAFLTGGRVPMDPVESFDAARWRLCQGRDVAVAVITGDRTARIAKWQQALRWDAPAVVPYRQANGTVVFELATFRANRDAPDCPR
jgi:hypothetical protein